jgi:hypothetical protein
MRIGKKLFDQGIAYESDIAGNSHEAQRHHRLHVKRCEREQSCQETDEVSECHGCAPFYPQSSCTREVLKSVKPGLLDPFLDRHAGNGALLTG